MVANVGRMVKFTRGGDYICVLVFYSGREEKWTERRRNQGLVL